MMWTIFEWFRRSAIFGLALTGAVALVLTAMMSVPVSRPPMMQSVINGVRTVDRSDMPPLSRFQARRLIDTRGKFIRINDFDALRAI